MDSRVPNRLSPEYVLLGYLYQAPDHGYELHKKLTNEFGYIWHASQSQTYNILKRLNEQGFIVSSPDEKQTLRLKQQLHITESGRKRFEVWLSTPTGCSVHAIRVEFITRYYFTQHLFPDKVQELLNIQSAVVSAGIAELQGKLKDLLENQIYNRLALELRIMLLVSVLDWLKECTERQGMIHGRGADD